MQEGVEKPKPKVLFEIGEAVRVKGRPVHRFPRHGRRRELRQVEAARIGDDFREGDAGGIGIRTG